MSWDFVEPHKRYLTCTINGQPVAIFEGSEIKAWGEASSGTVVVIPPASAPTIPRYYARNGESGAVPSLVKLPT